MKKLFGVVAAVSMALTGCASTCDELEDASKTLAERYRPCTEGGGSSTFDVSQCGDNIGKCSSKDKEALADFSDCIQDLPRCTPDTEDEFFNEVFTCAIDLFNKADRECLEATGIFSS